MSEPAFFIPPEWAPQSAIWIGWPHLDSEWGDAFEGARREIAQVARRAARYLPVRIACGSEEAEHAAAAALSGCTGSIDLVRIPTGDIWLRDTGPVIAREGNRLRGLGFRFNGWGGKYIMPGDRQTAAALAAAEALAFTAHDFVLEGGAIELDGAGRLMTTRQCLLNPNRNTGWDQAQAEHALRTSFNVDQIIWLDQGLRHDHTDGHIDNLARFVGPGHAVCQTASGADDVQADRLQAAEAQLRASGLQVTTMPSPGRVRDATGADLPASHMNFTLINGAVLLPVYEDQYSRQAVGCLERLFPDRDILTLPARAILAGGGSLHCMTREIPHIGQTPSGQAS